MAQGIIRILYILHRVINTEKMPNGAERFWSGIRKDVAMESISKRWTDGLVNVRTTEWVKVASWENPAWESPAVGTSYEQQDF